MPDEREKPPTPYVFRTPNGVVVSFGDITRESEIDLDATKFDPIVEMRRADPLPDPANLTIGDVDDALLFIERCGPIAPAKPELHDAVIRRDRMLAKSPGYAMLRDWWQAKGVELSTVAVQEFIRQLAKKLRKPFPFIRSLSADKAVELLAAADPTTGDDRQEAGKANKGKGESDKPLTLDDLKATAWKLLTAIRDLNATDSGKAVNQKRIAVKARTGRHDSKHNQEAFGQLSELKLIKAVRNVGTWITQAGTETLNNRSISG
jgi:hypothetical protein